MASFCRPRWPAITKSPTSDTRQWTMLSWSQGGIIRSFPGHHRSGQHGDVRWAYPGCIGVVPSGSRRRLEHKAETGQLLRPLSARPLGDAGRHEKPGGFVTPLIISGTNFSRSHRKTQIECLLSQVLGGGDGGRTWIPA